VAQKAQVLLVDDLDGGEAEGTVRLGLDSLEYEIDLSAEHAEALRRAMAPFVSAARRGPAAGRRTVGGGRLWGSRTLPLDLTWASMRPAHIR
jgi:Lsr2